MSAPPARRPRVAITARRPRVAITRPLDDAMAVADDCAARGFASLIAPMLKLRFLPPPPLDPAPPAGLIFTSANGVRAVAAACGEAGPERGWDADFLQRIPVYAVGGATAEAATAAGFVEVVAGPGDARGLAEMIADRAHRGGLGAAARRDSFLGRDRLLHVRGRDVAYDIREHLGMSSGLAVEEFVLYETRPAESLGPDLADALRAIATAPDPTQLAGILFFSPKTAAVFADLARAAGRTDGLRHVDALCLSSAVAAKLEPLPWRRTRVATRPDRSHLLGLLDGLS